jgi:hypothetical protein
LRGALNLRTGGEYHLRPRRVTRFVAGV